MEKVRNKKKRKGFTLTELIVVIAIAAILAAASIGVGAKQVAKARIQETTMFLQTIAESIEEGIMDMGFLTLNYTDAAGYSAEQTAITNWIDELADVYLACDIDRTSIAPVISTDGYVGFSIKLTMAQDAWDQPYVLYYLTNYSSLPDPKMPSDAGYFIAVASIGPNSVAAGSETVGYYNSSANGGVDDDIVVIMQSR